MKTILSLILFITLMPLALADNTYYLGVQTGYQVAKLNIDSMTTSAVNGATLLNNSNNINLRKVPVQFYVGMGHYFNNPWYLGLEGLFDINNHLQIDGPVISLPGTNTVDFRVKRRLRYQYRIDVMPGYKICNGVLAFIHVGYDAAQFDSIPFSLANDPAPNLPSRLFNKWLHGYDIGVGLDTQFWNHLNLRIEYTHQQFKSFSTQLINNVINARQHFKISADEMTIGLEYHIA